jgi:hypothetical protein
MGRGRRLAALVGGATTALIRFALAGDVCGPIRPLTRLAAAVDAMGEDRREGATSPPPRSYEPKKALAAGAEDWALAIPEIWCRPWTG